MSFDIAEMLNALDSTDRITILHGYIELYKKYAQCRLDECDWHGLADAAMDLRELEAEIRGLELAKVELAEEEA